MGFIFEWEVINPSYLLKITSISDNYWWCTTNNYRRIENNLPKIHLLLEEEVKNYLLEVKIKPRWALF